MSPVVFGTGVVGYGAAALGFLAIGGWLGLGLIFVLCLTALVAGIRFL